jgi:ABC-2 type transport system permease protein
MSFKALAPAFFLRDARIALSYRTAFLLATVSALVNIGMLFFLSGIVGGPAVTTLDRYGGNYFGFVIVGVAFASFLTIGLAGLGGRIRESQLMGTLELMVLSPTQLTFLLVYSSLWSHAFASLNIVVYIVVGTVLGMDIGNANVGLALLGMALAVVSFNALGLIAGSIVIIIKQGDPVTWVMSAAATLLSGVFYPVAVLPEPLQVVAQALPLTHALEIVRQAVLVGAGFADVWPSVLALVILTAILLPLGHLACLSALRVALRDGSLSHY